MENCVNGIQYTDILLRIFNSKNIIYGFIKIQQDYPVSHSRSEEYL